MWECLSVCGVWASRLPKFFVNTRGWKQKLTSGVVNELHHEIKDFYDICCGIKMHK